MLRASLAVSDCPHLREIRLVHCCEINQASMSMLLTATPAKLIAVSFIHTPITPRAVTLLTGEDTPLVCIRVLPFNHFVYAPNRDLAPPSEGGSVFELQ